MNANDKIYFEGIGLSRYFPWQATVLTTQIS